MTGKRARSKLLDEYCEVTGHDRKYANKLLLGLRGAGPPGKAGRKSTYGPEVVEVLKRIWFLAEQACGKRLAPVLPLWMGAYEKRHGSLGKGLKEKVLKISPAQIDRVLAPVRVKAGKRPVRAPKSNAALKALTPIRAEAWDVEEPGWLEADTVAHGGGSTAGNFVWSLSSTDIYSGWTETGASWNKGKHAVCGVFEQMEKEMARHDPIEMKEEIEKRLKQVWEMKESLEAADAEEEGAEAPPGESPPALRSGGLSPGEEAETKTERTKSKTESPKQSQLTPV